MRGEGGGGAPAAPPLRLLRGGGIPGLAPVVRARREDARLTTVFLRFENALEH